MPTKDYGSDASAAPAGKQGFSPFLAAMFAAAPGCVAITLVLLDLASWGVGVSVASISAVGSVLLYRFVRRLERAKHTAEAASRSRGEFLATVSHEIRTSLNGILGMTELTLSTELSGVQRGYLGMVKESANALLIILNDILDFSKAESGRVVLERRAFDLHRLIERTTTLATTRARGSHLELVMTIDPAVPRFAVGDEVRVGQLLSNLISNSVKFADRVGIVVVRVERGAAPSPSEFTLRISVADSGVGIPSDKLDAIFEPFIQAEEGTTRRFGGTGLGLSISRRLVELMGGQLTVRSVPEIGTRFTVSLNLSLAGRPQDAERSEGGIGSGPSDILVVDDNPVNQVLISTLLEKRGARAVIAKNGADAIREIRARMTGDAIPFRLILMDCQMPVMDGFEATAHIRRMEEGRSHVAIVALTGDALTGAEARCQQAGMDGYLQKPIDLEALEEVLGRFAKR